MSVIATLVDPVQRHTPFTGGTDRDRLLRGAARGETIFTKNDIWAAPGSGNNRSINFTCDLDNNFAWVLTDASCTFLKSSGEGVIYMESVGLLEISIPSNSRTEYIYGQFQCYPSRQNSAEQKVSDIEAAPWNSMWPVVTDTGAMTFDLLRTPTYMLIPFSQSGNDQVTVSNIFSEAQADKGAYSYRFAARFLQYDINQAYDYRVQSPLITR